MTTGRINQVCTSHRTSELFSAEPKTSLQRCGEVTSMLNTEAQSPHRSEALREYQSHNLTLTVRHQTETAKAAQIEMTCQTMVNEQSEPWPRREPRFTRHTALQPNSRARRRQFSHWRFTPTKKPSARSPSDLSCQSNSLDPLPSGTPP